MDFMRKGHTLEQEAELLREEREGRAAGGAAAAGSGLADGRHGARPGAGAGRQCCDTEDCVLLCLLPQKAWWCMHPSHTTLKLGLWLVHQCCLLQAQVCC